MFAQTVAAGRLTRDPETKTFSETSAVTRFSIAVEDGFGDKKTTHYYNCSAWNAQGKSVQNFCKKGSTVIVTGKFISSKKESTTYWELRADSVKFISTGDKDANQGAQQQQSSYQQQSQPSYQQQTNEVPAYLQQAAPAPTPSYATDMFANTGGDDSLPF